MRLGRLAVVGLATGLVVGFAVALLRPRRRALPHTDQARPGIPVEVTIDLTGPAGSAPSAGDTARVMVDDGRDDVTAPGSDDETVARTR